MIEEFKNVLLKYFESQGKVIRKDNVILLSYEEVQSYAKGFFTTTLPNCEYYDIVFNGNKNEFSLDVYKRIRNCRITKNEE